MNRNTLKKWLFLTIKYVAWAPIAVFILHVVTSKIFHLYALWPEFDIPMHILGGVVISYFFNGSYHIANRLRLLGQPARYLQPIMVFALGSTATIFWEFAEFTSDQVFGTHMQGGLEDTLLDMLLGMVGTYCMLLLVNIQQKKIDSKFPH